MFKTIFTTLLGYGLGALLAKYGFENVTDLEIFHSGLLMVILMFSVDR